MNRLNLSLLNFVGNTLYESHTTYDVLSKQTDVNVNCHQASAFHYLSRQDPVILGSGNTGKCAGFPKVIAANA